MKTLIELEDNGQDFLEFTIKDDIIVETWPFQGGLWNGARVPIIMVEVGKELPIHKPPEINFGFLKHKVKSIKDLEDTTEGGRS